MMDDRSVAGAIIESITAGRPARWGRRHKACYAIDDMRAA
jgi:hypothetical protein